MTAGSDWLRFRRAGGTTPADDEELVVHADGTFTARRTVAGRRIGRFAGTLPGASLRRLRAAADAIADAADVEIPTPRHGATEVLELGGRTLRLGSNERAPQPWRTLLDRIRSVVEDDVVELPEAAVELVADARTAALAHAGSEPIEVDLGSIGVRLVRVDADGLAVARWHGRPGDRLVDDGESIVAVPGWVTAGPGWRVSLPFDHPMELAPGDWLQAFVAVTIRDGAGERPGRLYAAITDDA